MAQPGGHGGVVVQRFHQMAGLGGGAAPGHAAVVLQQHALVGAAQKADSLGLRLGGLPGKQLNPAQCPHRRAERGRLYGLPLQPHDGGAGRVSVQHTLNGVVFLIDLQVNGQVLRQGLGPGAEHLLAVQIHANQHILGEGGLIGPGNGDPYRGRADPHAEAAVAGHQKALGFHAAGRLDDGLLGLEIREIGDALNYHVNHLLSGGGAGSSALPAPRPGSWASCPWI